MTEISQLARLLFWVLARENTNEWENQEELGYKMRTVQLQQGESGQYKSAHCSVIQKCNKCQ